MSTAAVSRDLVVGFISNKDCRAVEVVAARQKDMRRHNMYLHRGSLHTDCYHDELTLRWLDDGTTSRGQKRRTSSDQLFVISHPTVEFAMNCEHQTSGTKAQMTSSRIFISLTGMDKVSFPCIPEPGKGCPRYSTVHVGYLDVVFKCRTFPRIIRVGMRIHNKYLPGSRSMLQYEGA